MKSLKKIFSFATLLIALHSYAAVPPLSEEDRLALSELIVEGTVTRVEDAGESSRYLHKIGSLLVESSFKGKAQAGELVNFTYKRAKPDPSGICGPQGQNADVVVGSKIKAYLFHNIKGTWTLLEPNGWDLCEACGH